jgi:nitrile hydratase alpha subunit
MASQDSTSGQVRTPSVDPGTGHARDFEAQVIAQAVQDPAFRARVLADPRAAFAEMGLSIPPEVKIQAVQETAGQYYLVLPAAAERRTGAVLSDADLEMVAGGTGPLESQDANWTGCASGQSGCVATNGCTQIFC